MKSGLATEVYEYYVTASYVNCEESKPSNKVVLDYINGTYIDDIELPPFRIYPNPAKNSVFIEGSGLIKVELFNLQGRLLAEYDDFKNALRINRLNQHPDGVYLIKMHHADGSYFVKKLVVKQ